MLGGGDGARRASSLRRLAAPPLARAGGSCRRLAVPPVARAGGPERDVVEAEARVPAAAHAQGEVEMGRSGDWGERTRDDEPAARVSILDALLFFLYVRGEIPKIPCGLRSTAWRQCIPTEIPAAVAERRARTMVGPTSSLRQVAQGHYMSLSSGRRGKNERLRYIDEEIRRLTCAERCEAPIGGHHIYLQISISMRVRRRQWKNLSMK